MCKRGTAENTVHSCPYASVCVCVRERARERVCVCARVEVCFQISQQESN